ncbi:hypothetical protein [Prochlorococcus sp. MIT 0604]|uniref:hypothetical protein n=1 Tax=Prochlorococcus sp. MIT 0604 TaxID=1501268 RepID=UPI0004F902B5|nr:hypothetical protein [Prochlorococcus sp. MIT 0604]AIQ94432.1 hypothetical protein EW14_0408 [Prochlorococcus sp. MIT 0604]
MNKERYKKEYGECSDLLWPNEKEDKITRKFYRDLTRPTQCKNSKNKIKKLSFFELIFSLINWKI